MLRQFIPYGSGWAGALGITVAKVRLTVTCIWITGVPREAELGFTSRHFSSPVLGVARTAEVLLSSFAVAEGDQPADSGWAEAYAVVRRGPCV